ncbi:hypothetical protein Ancab_018115 [Ancistrocladus abbreviatus]
MPGKSVDTYIFALYDEDLKPGPTSERLHQQFPSAPSTTPSAPSTTPVTPSGWCVPKAGVSDAELQANLDYACGQGIDCSPVQPGGSCFEPNTVASHAAYAMNLYYQTAGRKPWTCDFTQTATVTSVNPSYNSCTYPGGGRRLGGYEPHVKVKVRGPLSLWASSWVPGPGASVNVLKEQLKQKRLLLLDTDVAGYATAQGKTPVSFGPTDLVCCRTLQGHTGKVYSLDWTPERNRIVSASQDGEVNRVECFNKPENSFHKASMCMGDDLCLFPNWSICCLWWS